MCTLLAGCAAASDDADAPPEPPAAEAAPAAGEGKGEGTLVTDDVDAPEPAAPDALDSAAAEDGGELAFDDPDELSSGDLEVSTAKPPQVVFVNFGGPVLRTCAAPCSNATTNHTFIIGQYLKRSQIDFAPFLDASRRTAIVSHLRASFARYDIRFTSKRPLAGAYTMVVVTPSFAPNHGVAPLDCGNTNRSDIAFVFRTGGSSAQFLAQEIAHELGHSFGLAHVRSNADFMQWASSGNAFTRATYDTAHPSGKCFTGSIQNAPVLLAGALGLR
jgi:hypothetical protein